MYNDLVRPTGIIMKNVAFSLLSWRRNDTGSCEFGFPGDFIEDADARILSAEEFERHVVKGVQYRGDD
ncbi:hypothetical protein VNO78_32777 [Psophocarpus tetragonolobus]|uniref:Uncharacterized protein n=1 Tax=Psophocarpus tetragonolobus TaxID=3891 RepID=A0AAN9RPN6_PSOTE